VAEPHVEVELTSAPADIAREASTERTAAVHSMGRTTWTKVVASVAVVAALAAALVANASTSPALTLLIPAYYPATGSSHDPWKTVPRAVKAKGTRAIEIMNANNGPGTSIGVDDPTAAGVAAYRAAIRQAHASGSTVYGYVWTNYANRGSGPSAPVPVIKRQINQWVSRYRGIDGIFFDGVTSETSRIGFYRTVDAYARARRLKVIFNPGTVPARAYMAIDRSAIVLDFEGSATEYLKTRFPSWTRAYPAARFANVVYAARTRQVPIIAARARRDHVGNIFVTNLTLPNPYWLLPRYFVSAELPALAATHP
jgi:hypothetical protein